MLQKIRDNTQGLFSKILMGLLIAVFALWGVDSIVGNLFVKTPKLTVNGDEIATAEIDNLAQRKMQNLIAQLGANPDLSQLNEGELRASAINELIQRRLLQQIAKSNGMGVSPAVIDQRIAQNPDFQIDGAFNAERAGLVLKSAGYTPNSYRAVLGEELVLNQILAAYTATGFATPKQVEQLATLVHQKRGLRFVVVPAAPFIDTAAVTDADIESYYQNHQNDFAQDEQVRVEFLELDKTKLMAEVKISEEELQSAYQAEVSKFEAKTERRASHILWEAKTEAELAAARKEAESVKAQLDAGGDFAALAAKFSKDTGSAQNGGDVGYTTGSNFVEPFETALQALAVNQVSAPVQTEFGIHLIKLTEQSQTKVESFEARRAALEQELQQKAADKLFSAKLDELKTQAFETPDLEGPATALGLTKQTSEFFTHAMGTGIASSQSVRDTAFGREVLEQGLNSEVLNVDANRSVVLHLLEHQSAQIRPLDVVKGEIELSLRQQKAKEQATVIGKTFEAGMQNGGNIDGLLAQQNFKWTQVDPIERVAPDLDPELTDKIFMMERPATGSTTVAGFSMKNGDYLVVELQSVTDGSPADFKDNEEASMRNFISQQTGANDITGFLKSLEARAKIKGRETQTDVQNPLL